ncbi:MAG: SDR family NAD(P)-dependent oxidoreductase [Turneriella sp.]
MSPRSRHNLAKFAVRGFTESLRQELEDTHIGVSCVHPGGIKTNIAACARYKSG